MSDKIPYLSDEELQKLMEDAEAESNVKAPDDLESKVIARIESRERKKTVDFATYCLRVGFGVAAAIALLTIVPFTPERQTALPKIDKVIVEKEIPTKEEVLGTKNTVTKEEAIKKETSLFNAMMDKYFD